MGRYITVKQATVQYGGTNFAWRRWVSQGSLAEAVVRFGRLVMIDTQVLDERLQRTGQLLVYTNDTVAKVTSGSNGGQ
jgi:hypothetical protein